jgi:DnaK suppressor protein
MESTRTYLERERERLVEEIHQQGILGEEHAGYGNHMADDATEVFEQTKSLALRRNLERMLGQVEDALRRSKEGTYGLCEQCGARIDPARLRVLPYATLCLGCQQHRERR